MELSKKSLVYKIAFAFSSSYNKDHRPYISICELFWRTIGTIVGSVLGLLIVGVWVWAVGSLIIESFVAFLVVCAIVVGILGTIVFCVWSAEKISDASSTNLVAVTYQGFKKKFCPIIDLKD